MPDDILHIRGQSFSHSPVLIEGNKEALKKLKAAIEEALSDKRLGFQQSFASDGEGYDILVLKREDMNRAALSYSTHCEKQSEDVISGWNIIERKGGCWKIIGDVRTK